MTECGVLNCEAGEKGMVASYPQTVSTSRSRSSTPNHKQTTQTLTAARSDTELDPRLSGRLRPYIPCENPERCSQYTIPESHPNWEQHLLRSPPTGARLDRWWVVPTFRTVDAYGRLEGDCCLVFSHCWCRSDGGCCGGCDETLRY